MNGGFRDTIFGKYLIFLECCDVTTRKTAESAKIELHRA